MILLGWYKRYCICLISLFNLNELLPAFICANNTKSLVDILFGVKIFNPFPFLLLHRPIVVTYQINLQILFISWFFLINPFFIFKQIIIIICFKKEFLTIIFGFYFFFFRHLITHSIHQKWFLANHYIAPKLLHLFLPFLFFLFSVFLILWKYL